VKLLYLINFEMQQFLKPLLKGSALLILCQQLLISIAAKRTSLYIPYEELFASSGAVTVFFLAFAAGCGLVLLSVLSNYYGSKSIYTLMTLPQNRSRLYYSKLIAGFMVFLILITAQLISALLGYFLYAPKIQKVLQETGPSGVKFIYEHAKNGLFLAFVRSGFFRLLYPLSLESLVSTIAILVSFLCGLYYGVFSERSRSYLRFAPVMLQVGYIVYILNYRLNAYLGFYEYQSLYLHSAVLLSFAAFFIWDSIRLIRRSAIS
jgi:hypothetical protein